MYDICCIGHITSDKVVNGQNISYQPGGTAWYFSRAVQHLPINYLLVTALAQTEYHYIDELNNKRINVKVQPSTHTVYFENIYGDDPDERTQNVLHKADSFKVEYLKDIQAKVFHLGPLLADDISADIVRILSKKAKISLDVQGYLREVIKGKVYPTQWKDKNDVLPNISILKADVGELRALTGCQTVADGVRQIAGYGVKEIIITNGSKGSVIYAGGNIYDIPAYNPKQTVDATGCGDTYMAGYLYRRVQGEAIASSGRFAAAMAALKMENAGPFYGNEADVIGMIA